nr:helix-turn-helix domain-containing protein [Isorropodon fossajaponicum symbiont]
MNNYQHLSPEERAFIMIEYNQGRSIRYISYLLNRSPSTISREIKRNLSNTINNYCATTAAKRYQDKRQLCIKPQKLTPDTLIV